MDGENGIKAISSSKLRLKLKLKMCLAISKIVGFHPAKNHPMVPPLDHFHGGKNYSPLARTISASFFANLTIGPEEMPMPILVWGRRKRPN